jgi:hypothetical protein
VRTQDRLVTELALVSRLLGQVEASTIHLTLSAIERAINGKSFRPGGVVMIPLREATRLISRESDLELLQPRGCA